MGGQRGVLLVINMQIYEQVHVHTAKMMGPRSDVVIE
jgi:hypothetical protein